MNIMRDQPRPRKILGMNNKLLTTTSMNDIPLIWPCGVLPAPNMALQYALTPNVQYHTMPFFPQTITNATATATNAKAQQHQNINPRESGNMTIQIGVQCVNKNNPININALNNVATSIEKVNLQIDPPKTELKEDLNLRTSPVTSTNTNKEPRIPKEFSSILGGGDPSDSVINSTTFEILKELAISGSETAEKLAYTHRNRPCFKKIDSLCARLKQDLVRPDGILPNINSQGTAWAVKDFIFVFTRIMNAWIIIKGYVYNTPDGLNKVRSALSPEFFRSFSAWQETTVNFVDNLIQSFINLDNLVQSQKNGYQKAHNLTPIKTSSDDSFDYSSSSVDDFVGLPKESTTVKNNYMYTMVEDSDLTQRENNLNGTYFKTGTYNFIKRESLVPPHSATTGIEQLFDENFTKRLSIISAVCDLLPAVKVQNDKKLSCDIRVLENKLSNVLMQRLMQMKNGDVFFKIQFCQNYFPDFIAQTPDLIDIRGIILKGQTGVYGHVFEVVHDIRLIIHQTKEYLKENINLDLAEAISLFQDEIEMIFAQEPFENYNFDHIKGIPNEVLYKSGK